MDQSRDLSGQQLYRFAQLYQAPAFVKTASVAQLCGAADLPPSVYADPQHRLYPCHTAAATWTSLAHVLDKQAQLGSERSQKLRAHIRGCGRIHGIEAELAALEAKHAAAQVDPEAGLPDEAFALVLRTEGAQPVRRYPLRNPAEVKAAAEYLLAHRDAWPFAIRRDFADRVLDKQAQLGVHLGEPLQEEMEKQAGYGAGTAKEAAQMLVNRVLAVRRQKGADPAVQKEMLKLASLLLTHPSQLRAPGARCQVASLVDDFDRCHGIRGYGELLPRVEDVLFGLTRDKMAACASEHVSTQTGSIYKLADIERAHLTDIRDVFGEELGEALTSDGVHLDGDKVAQVLPTLPLPDARLFDRLLVDRGVRPVAKEASARAVGVSNAFLRQLRAAAG